MTLRLRETRRFLKNIKNRNIITSKVTILVYFFLIDLNFEKTSVSFQLLFTQLSYLLKKCIGAERHPIQFFFGSARKTLLTYCYSGTLKPAACLWGRCWRVIVRVLSTLKQRNKRNQQDFWTPLYLTFSHLPSSTSLEVLCNQRVCKRVVVRVLILKCLSNT